MQMQTQTQMEMQASSHVQRKRKEREIRKRKKYFSKMANNDWAWKRTQIQTSENENGSSYKLLCYTKIFHDIDKGRNLSEVRIDND